MTRRIWLCADDYGIAPGVNAAVRDLIEKRRLNATSVMTVAPSLDRSAVEALDALAKTNGVAVGLHITLTAPFEPLTRSFRPQRGGGFPPLGSMIGRAATRLLDATALAGEIDAQFAAFATAFGRPPAFVDGHQHVHLFPQTRDAVLAAVRRHAPNAWIRQCGRPPGAARAKDPKALVLDLLSLEFRRRAASARLRTNPAFAGAYVFDGRADFAALFPRFLKGLPDGGVVMCHPGTVDPELQQLDPLTHLREREYDYLAGDIFPQALAQAGVELR